MKEGSRIVDAINAAGGTTSKANISKVNLVYVLTDGMKVNIPNDGDLSNNVGFEYITMNSGDDAFNDYGFSSSNNGSNSSVWKGFGLESGSISNSESSNGNYVVININTAKQTELESLPRYWTIYCLKYY